jgi:carbonic anhydrase
MKYWGPTGSTRRRSAPSPSSRSHLRGTSRSCPAWTRGSTRRKYAGLAEGDAHVIRNAGGRASDDAIRSLVISYNLLGTNEWFVVHHTNCGMEFFTDGVMRGLLGSSLETAQLGPDGFTDIGPGPGSAEANYIDWLTIADLDQSVVDDVARIRAHPLVPGRIPIYGYIYDVTTGRLNEILEATKAGEPRPG